MSGLAQEIFLCVYRGTRPAGWHNPNMRELVRFAAYCRYKAHTGRARDASLWVMLADEIDTYLGATDDDDTGAPTLDLLAAAVGNGSAPEARPLARPSTANPPTEDEAAIDAELAAAVHSAAWQAWPREGWQGQGP